jgi:AAA+ superfamily predicted ATPase
MSRPRKPANREASEIFDALTVPEFQMTAPPEPTDPAEIAAACLLEELAARQTVPFGQPELNIIEVPYSQWVEIVMLKIQSALYGRTSPGSSQARKTGPRKVAVEIHRGAEFFGARLDNARSLTMAVDLLSSTAVWIVTEASKTSRDRLSVTVVASADRVLVLPEFSDEAYARFLGRATGAPPRSIWQPPPLTELNPSVLRLAARPKQTADDYARRIAKIVEGQISTMDGESKEKPVDPDRKIGLDDLHGMPAVIEFARALSSDIRDYKAGRLPWRDAEKGAIFVGPPGVGKTSVARAIADHCEIPFLPSSYSAWQGAGSGHLGSVTRAIHDLFKTAQEKAPCIVFLDELDSVNSRGSTQTRHPDWWRAVINTLLEVLDSSTAERDGVVVLAASNSPSTIDPALLRAGRLSRQLYIGFPDAAALSKIYRYYLDGSLSDDDYMRLGAISIGKTGADVEQIARGARRRARTNRREVRRNDVFAELVGDLPPPGDRSLWSTAIHEAGHAAVMEAKFPGRLRVVSLFGQGNAIGSTIGAPSDNADKTAATIDAELAIMLAGRAAEEVILGYCTSGCGGPANSDLARANWMAFTAEACLGLGTSNLLWSPVPEVEKLHKRFAAQPEAAKAANLRMQHAYEEAKIIVAARHQLIESIAEALLEQYVLTAAELAPLLIAHTNDADGARDAVPQAGNVSGNQAN